jgi:hypothetical protein
VGAKQLATNKQWAEAWGMLAALLWAILMQITCAPWWCFQPSMTALQATLHKVNQLLPVLLHCFNNIKRPS